MARVVVSVSVRDLTQAELARMRQNFNTLGQDMNRLVANRTRANFDRLNQALRTTNTDLQRLRGNIPDAEFYRLDDALRQAQTRMNRGFGHATANNLAQIAARVNDVRDSFRDLDQTGEITVRLDTSALARADAQLTVWRRAQEHRAIQVPVHVNTRQTESRIRRWAMGPLRGLMGLVGGTLSDGIGQGMVGAFRSPTFGVLIVGAIVAALSLAGAAIAGALVLALGGAFVGIAAMSAAKSDEVQRNWKHAAESMGKDLAAAGEPLIPVVHRAVHMLENMSSEFAPKFKEAMEKAAPHLDDFLVNTREGFRKMGQHAWDDLQEAFRVFLVAFGPEWEDFLAEFGKSLGALARTVSEHSTEMAMALRLVLGVINFLIDAINFFANAWVMSVHFFNNSVAFFLEGVAMLTDGFMGMIDGMLAGLESVGEFLGFGDEVAAAREAFGQLRSDAVGQLQGMADQARQLNVDLDHANRKRKLEVDVESWMNQLARAKEELKTVPPEKRTELLGRIEDLQNKINSANGQLANMRKDYYVTVHYTKVGDWAIGGGGPGQAFGGITGSHVSRAATGGARNNMTLVGESGPELVNLAPGSHVRSNADSRRMLGQQTSGGGSTLVLKSSGRRVDDLLIEILRDAIHQRGGDPVTVLGGNR